MAYTFTLTRCGILEFYFSIQGTWHVLVFHHSMKPGSRRWFHQKVTAEKKTKPEKPCYCFFFIRAYSKLFTGVDQKAQKTERESRKNSALRWILWNPVWLVRVEALKGVKTAKILLLNSFAVLKKGFYKISKKKQEVYNYFIKPIKFQPHLPVRGIL